MEGISLGTNCDSAIFGADRGLRSRKEHGYKTCPFDLMLSNQKGIIECLNDDFLYFCDVKYLTLIKYNDETFIYNTKYRFLFNHESPGHADLYIKEQWENGINHFILNNYEEFIKRYNRRIQNFRDYLNSGKKIIFLSNAPKIKEGNNLQELYNTIKQKYPNLDFSFHLFDFCNDRHRNEFKFMQFSEEEIKMILDN